jgi:hypothetical protein
VNRRREAGRCGAEKRKGVKVWMCEGVKFERLKIRRYDNVVAMQRGSCGAPKAQRS